MNKQFLSNILLLLLVNLLIKPFFIFGIDLAVQNRAEAGAYGMYFALLNWSYLFQIISDFGIQNYNARHVSGSPHLMEKYFPHLLAIKIVLSAVYFSVALLAAVGIGQYRGAEIELLAVLLFNMVLVQMILFLRTNISGLGHYKTDSLLSALDKLLMLFLCGGVLLWHGWYGTGYFPIKWFALSQTSALLLTLIIVYMVLRHYSALPAMPSLNTGLRRGWPVFKLLFKQSLPFAIVVLLMSAYTRMDSIILERILPDGAYHADIFAGGYRLLDALNMFGYLFATLLLPMFARQISSGESVRPLTVLSFKLIWLGSITACSAVFFNRHYISMLMFGAGQELTARAEVLGILIWSFVSICVTYIFSTLLTAGAKTKAMNWFFSGGILIDLSLNFILIPNYQAAGAAIATLFTQTFVALGMVVLCWRYYHVTTGIKGMARLGIFTGLVLFTGHQLPVWLPVHWLINFGVTLLSGVLFAFFTNFIRIKDLIVLLRKS